ncbi:MAG: acetyl-CoA carboxylase biotin carboxyl carrier protein [Flavobacteriales bacterium]|nr:acetyl-CoA carboxylase biotin carboxyl carrier protein [Flavobacteriales bacterium]
MKLEEIQALIKFVSKSGVSEVELEMNDIKLVIKTEKEGKAKASAELERHMYQAAIPQMVPVQSNPAPVAPAASAPVAEAPKQAAVKDSNYIEIKSPMIGTFYRSAGPDKPPFKNVGDDIKPGDVICIIEAMKLFNEIESEISGKVVKVLVDDASPVEYDQPLFLVDPS